jgi:hypothetical protein
VKKQNTHIHTYIHTPPFTLLRPRVSIIYVKHLQTVPKSREVSGMPPPSLLHAALSGSDGNNTTISEKSFQCVIVRVVFCAFVCGRLRVRVRACMCVFECCLKSFFNSRRRWARTSSLDERGSGWPNTIRQARKI